MEHSPEQTGGFALKAQRLLDLLDKAAVPVRQGVVLDYGCGEGGLALELAKRGLDVRGLEINPEHVALARRRFEQAGYNPEHILLLDVKRERFKTEAPYTLPISDCSITTVVSIQVFEHVSDLDSMLSELARILVPGGTVYTEFPPWLTPVEPHIKLPFAHWLPHSRLRAHYIQTLYDAGLGIFRESGGAKQNDYLRTGVFYRPNRALNRLFSKHFEIQSVGALRVKTVFRRRHWPDLPVPLLGLADRLLDTFYERSLLLRKPLTG